MPDELDELQTVRDRFRRGDPSQALLLTILPTLACNLRCRYCYQQARGPERMSVRTCDAIVREAQRWLDENGAQRIEVDWFGGEPLLCPDLITDLSDRLMRLAQQRGTSYEATMATNGTLLDGRTANLLADAGLTELQITLDGPPHVHNRRRPRANGEPTFDAVMSGIVIAAEHLCVLVRVNVCRDTLEQAFDVLDLLDERGCFLEGKQVLPYLAPTGPLSRTCIHTARTMVPLEEFYDHVLRFQRAVLKRAPHLNINRVLSVPRPLSRPCGAQSEGAICIHPSGKVYKCALEVHDPTMGGGYLSDDFRKHPNFRKYVDGDPFARKECTECLFFPLCLGGCPKYNFADGSPFEREACLYWRHVISLLKQYASAKQAQGT